MQQLKEDNLALVQHAITSGAEGFSADVIDMVTLASRSSPDRQQASVFAFVSQRPPVCLKCVRQKQLYQVPAYADGTYCRGQGTAIRATLSGNLSIQFPAL